MCVMFGISLMQRIIAEHKQAMKKMEESLEQEKQRQLSHLEREIKRRRERKERKQHKKLEEKEALAVKHDDEEERRQVQEIQQKQAEKLQLQLKHGVQPSTPIHKKFKVLTQQTDTSSQSLEQLPTLPPNLQLGDVDINQLLLSTPLFGQLAEIEKALQIQSQKGPLGTVIQATAGAESSYIDIKDAQWECKGELAAVDLQDLKPSDFVVYRFGAFVASLLHKRNQLPKVTLLLASNLPPNNYTHNCFRNSFFYQHSKKILFIRKERLESVGEFVVVIMHCLSHVKVGDLANDTNPVFLREFYQVSH